MKMILQILLMKIVNLKKLSLHIFITRTEVSLVKNVFCQGKKKCLNNSQNQTCHSLKKKKKKSKKCYHETAKQSPGSFQKL